MKVKGKVGKSKKVKVNENTVGVPKPFSITEPQADANLSDHVSLAYILDKMVAHVAFSDGIKMNT